MSDTVMLVVGLVGWAVVGALVWWVDRRRGEIVAKATDQIVRAKRDVVELENGIHDLRRRHDNELDLIRARIEEEYGNSCAMGDRLGALISDLNLRVARAEATIAATPTPPDPATIIAAATAPLLALTEQYTAPHPFTAPQVAQPTAGDGEWSAEDIAAYDPFDAEFPETRAADDYSPPATFGGLGIDLPRLEK